MFNKYAYIIRGYNIPFRLMLCDVQRDFLKLLKLLLHWKHHFEQPFDVSQQSYVANVHALIPDTPNVLVAAVKHRRENVKKIKMKKKRRK